MALTARESGGYAVNSVSAEAVGSGSTNVRVRFRYPSKWLSSVTGFNVIWYAYGDKGPSSAWVVQNSTVNKNESVDGWWQHVLAVPEDPQAQHLYAWVAPVASGKWKSGPDWAKSKVVSSPWVSAEISAARGQLGGVSADFDGTRVTIGWSRVNEYQRYVNVYRSVNGGSWSLYRQVGAASGEFVDSGIAAGSSYRYRLRAALADKSTTGALTYVESDASFDARPLAVRSLAASCAAAGSLRLSWANQGRTGGEYQVEWSANASAWAGNASSDISSATLEQATATVYTITGLDSAQRWYARVRRANDAGESAWSDIVSTLLGTVPAAPTIAHVPASVAADATVTLSWTHNCEDASAQSAYQVQARTNNGSWSAWSTVETGTTATTVTLSPAALGVSDGGQLQVQVRTKGVLDSWGAWSAVATVQVWAQPSVGLSLVSGGHVVDGEATAFPMQVRVELASHADGNAAVSWWVALDAAEDHVVVARDGTQSLVKVGDRVWHAEGVPDDGTEVPSEGDACNRACYLVTITAADVRLARNVSYAVRVGVATSAGMRAESELALTWSPSGEVPEPDAALEYDAGSMTMLVTPSCADDGGVPVVGVTLDVWRVELEGTVVPVAEGLSSGEPCVDPHPDFGDCVYRVVAIDPTTGEQGSADVATYVDEASVVIQWDEQWDAIAGADELAPGVRAYAGSRVRLPYDMQLSEERESDMVEVEYQNRRWPVLYGGTIRRHESTTTGTLYEELDPGIIARVLSMLDWGAACYVREPARSGYWASVRGTVSQDQAGLASATLRVRRVEG